MAPLWEVAAWAANLPKEAATSVAESPSNAVSLEASFLRLAEHSLRVMNWQRTKDGQANRNRPEPHFFPWEERPDEGGWRGDAHEWDDLPESLADPRLMALMSAA